MVSSVEQPGLSPIVAQHLPKFSQLVDLQWHVPAFNLDDLQELLVALKSLKCFSFGVLPNIVIENDDVKKLLIELKQKKVTFAWSQYAEPARQQIFRVLNQLIVDEVIDLAELETLLEGLNQACQGRHGTSIFLREYVRLQIGSTLFHTGGYQQAENYLDPCQFHSVLQPFAAIMYSELLPVLACNASDRADYYQRMLQLSRFVNDDGDGFIHDMIKRARAGLAENFSKVQWGAQRHLLMPPPELPRSKEQASHVALQR